MSKWFGGGQKAASGGSQGDVLATDNHSVFFFSSRSRPTRSYGDWSSDVCSSDLLGGGAGDGMELWSAGWGTCFLGAAGGTQPVGVGPGLDDQGVEGEPVHDRGGQAGVGEGLAPLAERRVGGHRDGGFLFPFGDDLEQQLGAAGVKVQVAQLVAAQQVQPPVAADRLG